MAAPYTAIVYFHGIGTQRRWEEISRLVDAFDQHAQTQDGATIGRLRDLNPGTEKNRVTSQDDARYVSYVNFRRLTKQGPESQFKYVESFRLYEGYWSSIIAEGVPPLDVLSWAFNRALTPFFALAAHWRSHQRLKLAFLFRMQLADKEGMGARRGAYEKLADAYDKFESWESRRADPIGRFAAFVTFLSTDENCRRHDPPALIALARRWRGYFITSQIRSIAAMLTLGVGLFGLLTFIVYALKPAIQYLPMAWARDIAAVFPAQPPLWLTYLLAPPIMVGAAAAIPFLRRFLGDVTFWTAREGRSSRFRQREAILEKAVGTLSHVLADPKCRRVVVIGHSLGSSIGYQALLEIGRRRKAAGDEPDAALYAHEKITHFITLGSPIEIIHYFFELSFSRSHRYNRIANEFLGSTASAPFRSGRATVIRWLNFHSAADPISGKIFSQGKKRPPPIEEVEVVSAYDPDPVKAHSGYFAGASSVARLFDEAILNRAAVSTIEPQPRSAKAVAHFGVRLLQVGLIVTAWALFVAALGYWTGRECLIWGGLGSSLAVAGAIGVFWIAARMMEARAPLDLWRRAAKRRLKPA